MSLVGESNPPPHLPSTRPRNRAAIWTPGAVAAAAAVAATSLVSSGKRRWYSSSRLQDSTYRYTLLHQPNGGLAPCISRIGGFRALSPSCHTVGDAFAGGGNPI